jgi:hypothetical protein
VRLQYEPQGPNGDNQWQQTPWGRLVVGVTLAQGLAQGLQMLFTAGILAGDQEAGTTVWATLFGILLLHGIQGLSLIIGGAITGAGQTRGILNGSLVGLVNGSIFLLVQQARGESLTEAALLGQPILHVAFGALGGLLGTVIWRPPPSIRVRGNASLPVRPAASPWPFFAGPICWIRVIPGVAVVVGGVVWSKTILDFVLEASNGTLTITSHLQAQLVSWEISAIATLTGAALAGATTFNGLKQGLCVGLGAALLLVGVHLADAAATLQMTVYTVASILCLTLAGGWFGCQLFPPIMPRTRHRGIFAPTP